MFVFDIILFVVLGSIAYQDLKERLVNWILFPLAGALMAVTYFSTVSVVQFYPMLFINIALISLIIFILFAYTRYIRGQQFLNVSFGLGDILFLYAFALGFPTTTFLVLFTTSIFFALICFQMVLKKGNEDTIPLAGLMSIFLIVIYTLRHFSITPSLFIS